MKSFALLNFLFFNLHAFAQILVIGTYDSNTSEGIYLFQFNSNNGIATKLSHIKTSNPSFLTVSSNKKFVFTVNQNTNSSLKGGSVSSFMCDKNSGTLSAINNQSSEGNSPCYIALDKTNKWLVTGNYSTGNFSIFKVNRNGEIQPSTNTVQLEGKSIDSSRQLSPHVHSTVFSKNNKILYVADLGSDKIFQYNFNQKTGKIKPSNPPFVSVKPGAGPRHIDISSNGKYLYLIQELSGTISLFSTKNSTLTELQTVSTLPDNFKGAAASADIHISPDGKFLYVSNRGSSNSIGIYKINKVTGFLTLLGHQSSLGNAPRNFCFDPSGKFLLVANQNSNEVVIFERNLNTGFLQDTGNRISVGKPVCLKWL